MVSIYVAMMPALLVHTTESRYPNFRAERGLDTLATIFVSRYISNADLHVFENSDTLR